MLLYVTPGGTAKHQQPAAKVTAWIENEQEELHHNDCASSVTTVKHILLLLSLHSY